MSERHGARGFLGASAFSPPQGADSQPEPGGVPAAAGDGSGGAARSLRQFRGLQVSRQRFASVAA